MIMELSAEEMDNRAQVFVSLKTRDMQGAKTVLKEKYNSVKEEDEYLRVYDVNDTESIVDFLFKKGHVVNEIKKNKIGLEEYYVELMSAKEEK